MNKVILRTDRKIHIPNSQTRDNNFYIFDIIYERLISRPCFVYSACYLEVYYLNSIFWLSWYTGNLGLVMRVTVGGQCNLYIKPNPAGREGQTNYICPNVARLKITWIKRWNRYMHPCHGFKRLLRMVMKVQ